MSSVQLSWCTSSESILKAHSLTLTPTLRFVMLDLHCKSTKPWIIAYLKIFVLDLDCKSTLWWFVTYFKICDAGSWLYKSTLPLFITYLSPLIYSLAGRAENCGSAKIEMHGLLVHLWLEGVWILGAVFDSGVPDTLTVIRSLMDGIRWSAEWLLWWAHEHDP